MKKFFAIWWIFFCLFLSSCFGGDRYELTQPPENIQKIEIIDVSFDFYPPSEEEMCQMEAYAVIDSTYWDVFLEKFQEVDCHSAYDPSLAVGGKTIRIQYADGLHELIGERTVFRQNADGGWDYTMDYFDGEEYHAFLEDVLANMTE